MGGVFFAISSFGVRSLLSYFYKRLFCFRTLHVPPVHSVLAVRGLPGDGQKEGWQPRWWHKPVRHVTHMESVSPRKACLGRPAWSLTPCWLLGKRFLSGKGRLRYRLSGCCASIPCQIAADTTATAICKAGIHVFFNVLAKCQ